MHCFHEIFHFNACAFDEKKQNSLQISFEPDRVSYQLSELRDDGCDITTVAYAFWPFDHKWLGTAVELTRIPPSNRIFIFRFQIF